MVVVVAVSCRSQVTGSDDDQPWAYIADSVNLDYHAGTRCDLQVLVDKHAPRGGLAFALPIDSPYYDAISLAVVEAIETEEMTRLFRKWWPTTECHATSGASRLGSALRGGTLRYYPLEALRFISSLNFGLGLL